MSKYVRLGCVALCAHAVLLAAPERVCRAEWGELSPAGARIAEALKAPTALEFIDTPLQDVIGTLKDHHAIEIRLDRKALDEVGIPSDTPITDNLRGVSLRSALRLMLRNLDLTYTIANEVLLITTPEQEESLGYVRVYPVADLIGRRGVSGSEKRDCEVVIKVITECVAAGSWSKYGGPGTIVTIPPETPRSLVVSQSHGVHEELADFLALLQQVSSRLEHLRKVAPREAIKPAGGSPVTAAAERRIAEALKDNTECEFINTPLQEVMDTLEDFHAIGIRLDQRALDEKGIPSDSPITTNLRGVSLASALRLMLRELDLTFVIRDEVLLITTPEEAETTLVTKIYPLLGPAGQRGGSTRQSYYDSLIKTITTVIQPESWSDVGGPGTIVPLSVGKLEALVVTQTGDVHDEVTQLLAREEFHEPKSPAPRSVPRRKRRRGLLRRR